MSSFFESDTGRLYATYETDTHETIVFEGRWERPKEKKPYLKWIRIEAAPLIDTP